MRVWFGNKLDACNTLEDLSFFATHPMLRPPGTTSRLACGCTALSAHSTASQGDSVAMLSQCKLSRKAMCSARQLAKLLQSPLLWRHVVCTSRGCKGRGHQCQADQWRFDGGCVGVLSDGENIFTAAFPLYRSSTAL
eukprot:1137087-Pelagomonas_calceolata.AAC.1